MGADISFRLKMYLVNGDVTFKKFLFYYYFLEHNQEWCALCANAKVAIC